MGRGSPIGSGLPAATVRVDGFLGNKTKQNKIKKEKMEEMRWENRPMCAFGWKKKNGRKNEGVVVCVEKKMGRRVEKWREVGDAPTVSGVWGKK